LQDGTAYTVLLNQLAPEVCTLEPLNISDPAERAQAVLAQAARIGTRKYITAKDVLEGSPNLNLAFVAHLFRTR
jgi:plastin-1